MPVRPVVKRVTVTPEMEAEIVKLLLDTKKTFSDIAKEHGVTSSTVSRINKTNDAPAK